MTKIFGVMGYPIGHSKSPIFQQAGLDACGIKASFEAWDVSPDELPSKIASFRDENFMGCCVTLPHKQNVIPLIDELSDTALAIGAVNWIIPQKGKLVGHNTDSAGFLRALREHVGFDPKGARTVVFGAGGAARACIHGLRTAGVTSLAIANRTIENARSLAAELTDEKFRPQPISLEKDLLADLVPYAALLVNASSMGFAGGPAPTRTPVNAELISGESVVYDIVYAPPMTPFLQEAELAGARIAGGITMLVYQGIVGFELSTGQTAPAKIMLDAIL